MSHMIVPLHITREEYLAWYQGSAKIVHAKTADGRTIQFPANILQPFVTHAGIKGTFAIYFDERNKFKAIKRLR